MRQPLLGGTQVATYYTRFRADGRADGRPLGVIAIHFRMGAMGTGHRHRRALIGERECTRVLLADAARRVIAASVGEGLLSEWVELALRERSCGHDHDAAGIPIAFHATPGCETYRGLGWSGAIVQKPTAGAASGVAHP